LAFVIMLGLITAGCVSREEPAEENPLFGDLKNTDRLNNWDDSNLVWVEGQGYRGSPTGSVNLEAHLTLPKAKASHSVDIEFTIYNESAIEFYLADDPDLDSANVRYVTKIFWSLHEFFNQYQLTINSAIDDTDTENDPDHDNVVQNRPGTIPTRATIRVSAQKVQTLVYDENNTLIGDTFVLNLFDEITDYTVVMRGDHPKAYLTSIEQI